MKLELVGGTKMIRVRHINREGMTKESIVAKEAYGESLPRLCVPIYLLSRLSRATGWGLAGYVICRVSGAEAGNQSLGTASIIGCIGILCVGIGTFVEMTYKGFIDQYKRFANEDDYVNFEYKKSKDEREYGIYLTYIEIIIMCLFLVLATYHKL